MAKNVPLDVEAYHNFREWLRGTEVIWRDVTDSAIVPAWGEAICREDCLDNENRTPGERAYITLKRHYPKLDLRWRKEEIELLSMRPPKKFDGQYVGELYTLDISAAYAQLYSRLFLHADFPNKRLRFPLAEIASDLWQDKQGRNAIVGIARSTRNKWVKGEQVWYVKKQNKYLSPVLWGQIQCILNEIAAKMITYGAIYINTDGYAFTSSAGLAAGQDYLSENGIISKSACGIGSIVGISALSIPGVKEPKELNVSKPVFYLEKSDFSWVEWWGKLKGEF